MSGGVHSAFIDGHYVYLTDDATGSMRVIELRGSEGAEGGGALGGVQARREGVRQPEETGQMTGGRYLHDVQVKDGLLYAGYWRDGLVILDVGNGIKGGSPTSPKLVSQLRFNYHELYGPGWLAGAHAVFRYKNYVFVGDEVFPAQFNLAARDVIPVKGIVHIVDVSDIEHPKQGRRLRRARRRRAQHVGRRRRDVHGLLQRRRARRGRVGRAARRSCTGRAARSRGCGPATRRASAPTRRSPGARSRTRG